MLSNGSAVLLWDGLSSLHASHFNGNIYFHHFIPLYFEFFYFELAEIKLFPFVKECASNGIEMNWMVTNK